MKKTILIFLLLIAVAFQVFAKTDDDTDGRQQEPALTVPSQDSGSDIADLMYKIDTLLRRVDALDREIAALRGEIKAQKTESIKNTGTWSDSFVETAPQPAVPQTYNDKNPAEEPEPRSGSGGNDIRKVLGVILFIIAALFVIFVVFIIKYQGADKKDRARSHERRSPRDSRQDANFHPSSRQPRELNDFRSPGTSLVFPAQSPAADPAAEMKPLADEISPLYHSAEGRRKRHNIDHGDIFLDVRKSDLERLIQGENIQLVLEKGGTRLSAQFVLVDNKDLYPNFHIYNEAKILSNENGNDKVLSLLYNLRGENLPGFVEACRPAAVLSRGDAFTVAYKGVLKIGSGGAR
jgi:hypothetical protein